MFNPQGSEGWRQDRIGKVTASRIADLMAKTKTGWGASRANYMAELIAERLTGVPAASFTNAAMQWGTETEPQARAAYEFFTGHDVTEVGLIDHPTIPMSGASPDGLVLDDGGLEIKCPNTATHIETLLSGSIPVKYADQMQWGMACTGRKWWDFVSFDPRMPEHMRFFCVRVQRDPKRIEEITAAVIQFQAELKDKLARLQSLCAEAA